MSAGADLILDAALKEASHDRFDHEAIARVVADLAVNAPPVSYTHLTLPTSDLV